MNIIKSLIIVALASVGLASFAMAEPAPGVMIYNPNNGSPCIMGNTGCPGFSGGGGASAYATSSAPSYTNNTTVNLSTDLSGNLRVYDSTVAAAIASASSTSTPAGTNTIGQTWVDPTQYSTDPISVASTSLTQIVPLVSGKAIYVTGLNFVVAGAESVEWEYGTGTNCGTGTIVIQQPQSFAANGGIVAQAGGAPVLVVPAGNALCILVSSTSQVSGTVTFIQR